MSNVLQIETNSKQIKKENKEGLFQLFGKELQEDYDKFTDMVEESARRHSLNVEIKTVVIIK